jgi:anti-sigma regulatory factor (Ser/Thr protein kinase)
MSTENREEKKRRVLGRVDRHEFVGRADELRRIVAHSQRPEPLALLLLLAPTAGVSELLRQAYDEIFQQRGKVIPIYFELPREEKTAVSTAIEFLNAFLLQYVAFRRAEPALCHSSLTLNDLLSLAPPADYEWIEQLIDSYNRERFGNDDETLIRWCLSAPQKVPATHGRPFVMLDAVALVDGPANNPRLRAEILHTFTRSNLPYLIAGLRRQMMNAVHSLQCDSAEFEIRKLEKLSDEDGRALIEHVAQKHQVALSEEVRDLLVQQFESSPFLITAFLHAAGNLDISLATYLACEKLYVDELMGGRLGRHFSSLLEDVAPDPAVRRGIIRLLYESRTPETRRASFEGWKRTLGLQATQLDHILQALHFQEFITWDGSIIEAGGGSVVWQDYLKIRYRLEIASEPRALVVAETITDTLKRAPHTMARYYRRAAAVGLRDVLARFDCQLVPAILFDYARFSNVHKGATLEEIADALDADTEFVRLPQVVHAATCAAFTAAARQLCDQERCVVAHAFTDGKYTDANQAVWLTAEIDSKLEVDREVVRLWCERLNLIAGEAGFGATRIWLVAREGFSPLASEFLAELGAYGSSRQQMELLTARLNEPQASGKEAMTANEFEMIVPMGDDNELIVAHTVEEIARRLKFRPEAVNQIKHAVVEAFINASEHSLSPDRKIYQRFRVENDKLVITISSRGIVPVSVEAQNGEKDAGSGESPERSANRRGLGLNMIKSLMDEVEFERVDEGTRLRMTKYLRS